MSGAKNLATKDFVKLSDTQLQKDFVKLRDFNRFIETHGESKHSFETLAKGGYFTLIDNPLVANVSLRVVAKGGFFTVILET